MEKQTGRLEAFSDGVFAIAITLLVLDLKVPKPSDLPGGTGLLDVLLKQWPSYLAFTTSFITILIMWVNHHNILRCIDRVDHIFLLLNGLLLMGITVTPFPTALLAEYLQHHEQHVAAAVFAGTFTAIAVLYNLLWRYAIYNDRLVSSRANRQFIWTLSRQYLFGPPMYLLSFALAFVSVAATLVVYLVLAIFFALPLSANRLPEE